jgi:ABC-type amino acid transport substrate-binding protein
LQLSSFKYLFTLYALFNSLSVLAESIDDIKEGEITFSYWNEAAPPFAYQEGTGIAGGIIKDFGDALAQRLDKQPHYLKLPVPRTEQYLVDGTLDVNCITSRAWKKTPDSYHWSPTLFEDADRLLIRKDSGFEINDFKDLEGKLLGVYNGYVYHPTIMNMIESGKVKTVKVNSVEKGILLLKLQRLDALIDFGIILRYQLKTADEKGELRLANLIADEYELSCAYSKKLSIPRAEFDTAISELIDKGLVSEILRKYR